MRLLCLVMMFFAFSATAQEMRDEAPLADAAKEAQARELFGELRCEVCAGQTIADSNAPLAQDMRILVREKVAEGQDNQQILSFFSERYGRGILMRPPVDASTAPLWLAPLFLVVLGAWFVMRYFTRKQAGHF
jgi:cytochrome c-type biogenesis protein CcmH